MLAFTFEICRDFHVNNMRTILRATRTARKYLINQSKLLFFFNYLNNGNERYKY